MRIRIHSPGQKGWQLSCKWKDQIKFPVKKLLPEKEGFKKYVGKMYKMAIQHFLKNFDKKNTFLFHLNLEEDRPLYLQKY